MRHPAGTLRPSLVLFLCLALLVPTIPALPQPGDDVTVLHDVELAGTYHYDTVVIGFFVNFNEDTTIYANEVYVEGELIGRNPTAPGEDAPDIRIIADEVLDVEGKIVARHGVRGEDATAADNATAGRGGDGGSVHLQLNSSNPLTVGPTGLVQAGSGASGGWAEVLTTDDSPPHVRAWGGPGGDGGYLALSAENSVLAGYLVIGSAGRGGGAMIDDSHVPAASSIGGESGRVGATLLPDDADPALLAQLVILDGAVLAAGGPANAQIHRAPAGQDGADAYAEAGDTNATCTPGPTQAFHCIILRTWQGADALAVAGAGGHGTAGDDGATNSTTKRIHGEEGSDGGDGGIATAIGGGTGCVTLAPTPIVQPTCGEPGEAEAYTGGGNAGDGGDAGWGPHATSELEDACSTPNGSQCWISPVDDTTVCGHAGEAGAVGDPGEAIAVSPGGAEYEYTRVVPGEPGSDGAYGHAVCDHDQTHQHWP